MADRRTLITGNTTATEIAKFRKPSGLDKFFASIFAYGTFGGATVSYLLSTDGGTTKIAVPDTLGAAISFTANSINNIETGVATKQDRMPILYAVVAGGTNASITFDVLDNT